MDEKEKEELLSALKAKWNHINESYQKMTFTLDTPAKRSRKENYEADLAQLEKDIQMLSRKNVFVSDY